MVSANAATSGALSRVVTANGGMAQVPESAILRLEEVLRPTLSTARFDNDDYDTTIYVDVTQTADVQALFRHWFPVEHARCRKALHISYCNARHSLTTTFRRGVPW